MIAGPAPSPVAITGGYPLGPAHNGRPRRSSRVRIAALIYGLSNGQQHGVGATAPLTALIASVLLMTAFIYIEGHSCGPMLPLAIFGQSAAK
jgi:hypothetical protein